MSDMRRREFTALVGGVGLLLAAKVRRAHAQQPAKIPRIGLLGATTAAGIETQLKRFRVGLRDLGYVEGENIFIDFRWAEGKYTRLAEFAAELIRLVSAEKGSGIIYCSTRRGVEEIAAMLQQSMPARAIRATVTHRCGKRNSNAGHFTSTLPGRSSRTRVR